MCVCVLVLRLLLSPYRGDRMQALSSTCKTDQADFTDWMSFLTSNLMEEISVNTEPLISMEKLQKQHLCINALILPTTW